MKVSKSGLFLFELIVVIFLFTISAAICISIFAKSYTLSSDSENLTVSSLKAETVAEVFKDGDGDSDDIIKALGADELTHDMIMTGLDEESHYTLNIYYDEEWNNTDEHNCSYILTVKVDDMKISKTGSLSEANIHIADKRNDTEIFGMVVKNAVLAIK